MVERFGFNGGMLEYSTAFYQLNLWLASLYTKEDQFSL